MKLDCCNDTVKFDSDEESLVMKLALSVYKNYLEEDDGIFDQDYVTKENLKIVSHMLDQFQYLDDVAEG